MKLVHEKCGAFFTLRTDVESTDSRWHAYQHDINRNTSLFNACTNVLKPTFSIDLFALYVSIIIGLNFLFEIIIYRNFTIEILYVNLSQIN